MLYQISTLSSLNCRIFTKYHVFMRPWYRYFSQRVRIKVKGRQDASYTRFNAFYNKLFGHEWPKLSSALMQSKQNCAVLNKFTDTQKSIDNFNLLGHRELDLGTISWADKGNGADSIKLSMPSLDGKYHKGFLSSFLLSNPRVFPEPPVMPNGLVGYYLLDAASLLPVICLDVGPDSTVLDMCASPGGKTVAMMQLLSERGGLVANEPTQSRRRKLRKVIQEYIPKGQTNITIRGMDGTKFGGLEPCSYDRILVDAPCSTDRHCLRSGFQTDSWSEKKSQKFSQLQNKLVMSALGSLTSDGRVVYSTCTMSPYENDGVIQGVLENFRHGGKNINIERISEEQIAAWGEMFDIRRTEHGFIVLPSVEKNWGPLYTSSLVLKS